MIDYTTWIKTLKTSIDEDSESKKMKIDLVEELTESIKKSKSFMHPSPSNFLSKELYPILPYFFTDSKLIPPILSLLKTIIKYSSHDLEFYSEILVQILFELWIAGKGSIKHAKKVIKFFLNKTRNYDIVWNAYINVGLKGIIGKGINGHNLEKDYSVVKRAKGVRLLREMLSFDSGNVLSPSKTETLDTAFWKVRQAIELILGFFKNKNTPISLQDAARNSLVKLIKKNDVEFLKQNLAKQDLDIFEEVEGKFVKKKYQTKISQKMGNLLPEMVEAGVLDPKMQTISEMGDLEDGTLELENLNLDVRKVGLKFGQLEFEDKNGHKIKTLDPLVHNDDSEDEIRTNKSKRKKKKKKNKKWRMKGKKKYKLKSKKSQESNETEDEEEIGNEPKSMNPYDDNLDVEEFLPFVNNLDPGKNDIMFTGKKGLLWGFIPIDLLKECIDFSLNWTVRFLALEKICVLVRTKTNLKNEQYWGLVRFVYVMFCNGKKISFLNKLKRGKAPTKKRKRLSKERSKKLYVKRNIRRKIVIKRAGGEREIKDKGVFEVDREMDGEDINDDTENLYSDYTSLTPPRAKILLLLIAEKVISYRSNLLFEPLLACLGDQHVGVRNLSFKLLSNTQRLFKTKLPALMLTYQVALKFDNVFMKVNLINLILLMIYTSGHMYTLQKIIKPVELLTGISEYLDDESIKLKLTAMNCLVGICKFWPDFGAQEILREILEDQVYGFLIDRLEGGKVEVIGGDGLNDQKSANGTYLEYRDLGKGEDKDFVKEIVEKEREFEERYKRGEIGYQEFAKFGIEIKDVKPKKIYDSDQKKDESNELKEKKPLTFTIDMKPPNIPKKEKKFVVKVPKGKNLNKKLRKDKLKYVNEMNAEEFKKYKGVDKGLRFNNEEELENSLKKENKNQGNLKLKAEEEIDNVMNEYMSDYEQYDGDFNDVDEGEDEGYKKYKRAYDLPQDVKMFKHYRKRMKKKARKEYKNNLKPKKKPTPKPEKIPVVGDHQLKFISMEQALKFMKDFQDRMDDMMDYNLVLADINNLRSIALHHPDLLFLADSPSVQKDSLPISTLIDHLCTCIDLEDPKIQAAVLKFISYLSFTFKKVLVAYLSQILSTLFTLYNKTSEEDMKRKTFRTLKVLAKYSGDLKFMAYILLMPTEMKTRYKKICSKMLEAMINGTPVKRDEGVEKVGFVEEYDRSNLNIFILEDSLLARLIKIASEWFGDASDDIRETGESLIGGIYLRFKERKKGKMFFWWMRKLVRQGEGGEADIEGVAEEYLDHPLNPHYEEKNSYLEGEEDEFLSDQRVGYGGLFKSGISKKRAVLITKYLKQNFGEAVKSDARRRGVYDEEVKELGNEPENENVFRRSSSNILGMGLYKSPRKEKKFDSDGGEFGADFGFRKKGKPEFFGGGGVKRKRNHELQDHLMQEIDKLINS